MNRIKIRQLNTNSISSKFEMLVPAVKENLNALLVSERKTESFFLDAQCKTNGFTSYYHRVDNDCQVVEILLYVKEDILSKSPIDLKILERNGYFAVDIIHKKQK